jgi:uncharacterized membrane protein
MIVEPTVITGLIIVIPILLTRYLLTSLLSKEAVRRAAFFPPTRGLEKPAYLVNIGTTLLLLVIPFFLYFLGACMVTRSWLLLAILLVFQVSVHFMILAEERWCRETFGETFDKYMEKVSRYGLGHYKSILH